jgi:LysR family transcriptional regulator, glycine cleavage system transcriptional activator
MVGSSRFPSLISIRAFEAAARHESFAKAASEVGTTAASISYHVRQLETQIGVQLFHRYPHRVVLTKPGSIVAAEAINAFAALSQSFARAVDADDARLHVTTLPTLGTSWLTPKLGRFRVLHPDITVELDLSVPAQDLAAGGFDIAIRNGHGTWPGLKSIHLFPAIFTPLCAPALLDAAGYIDNPDRPLHVPLLGRPDWWELWYKGLGHKNGPATESFGISLSAEHLDIASAIAGHGVAIGSPIIFADEIAAGRLVSPHKFVATDGRAFWLTFPLARQHSRKVAKFREWLLTEVGDHKCEFMSIADAS